jgi:hypothetical protein
MPLEESAFNCGEIKDAASGHWNQTAVMEEE